MATYIVLSKFTQQGIQTIKDAPKRRAAAEELAKSLGGELKQAYVTMGQYDLVAIVELPDNEAAAKMAMRIGGIGNLSTATLVAFDEAATDRIVASL